MRDAIAKAMLATALRLPMPAPHGCVAVALRGKAGAWDGAARTRPFPEEGAPPPRYLIYSLTKTIIAAAILKLAEQQRLQLDDAVATILPSAPFAEQITFRQLLNHTSGLPDYGALPQYHEAVRTSPDRPWRAEEFTVRTCATGPAFAPGKGWLYSNIGYLLLKQTIEAICQQPFAVAMKELIFAPHGLAAMSVAATQADLATLIPGLSTYLTNGGAAVDVRRHYHPGWVAHGVVASTAADVASFWHALFAGQIVTSASLAEMRKAVRVPQSRPPFHAAHYGLGLMCDPEAPGGVLYGHTGGGPGYHSAAYCFESASGPIAVVVLINAEIEAETLAFELGALLRGAQARV